MSPGTAVLAWALLASSQAVSPSADSDRAMRTIAAWREALELDLPSEVLETGPELVAGGGPLAQEGEALALVARALFDGGREDEARALLAAAEPSKPTRVFLELERVREWILEDELERAIEALRAGDPSASAPRFPERPQSWLLLGRALVRAGRGAEARPFLERYVELEPFGPDAYAALHMLAQAAIARGDGAAARELGARAQRVGEWRGWWRVRTLQVREAPGEPLPRLGLAQLYLQIGEHAWAEAILQSLLAGSPDFAPGWFHLGEARRALGNLPGARSTYSRALELDPDHALARYNRAVLLLSLGEGDGARADLEHLVAGPHASDPKLAGAHLLLARLLLEAGLPDLAAERYARYRELGGQEPLQPSQPRR